MGTECLRAALRYARRGWAVFPLEGKRPYRGTNGHNEATTDAKIIRAWWKQWPEANVGIACSSQNGPIVIDIDAGNGAVLLELLDLPETREAVSRPGRKHLYYGPMKSRTEIPRIIKIKYEGVKYDFDILGDGGYVVAPPSVHPETGKRYRWASKQQLAPLPKSILRVVKLHQKGSTKAANALPETIGEGERDNLLTSLAGSMRRRGASPDAILAALREENATRVNPPLSDRQLAKIASSIGKKEPVSYGESLSDLGNARRFIAGFKNDVRYVGNVTRRAWRVWDGVRWVPDVAGEVERNAKNTVRGIYDEAANTGDTELQEKLYKHALQSEQAGRIRGMMDLASTEPEIYVPADGFDSNPWLLNLENGTLDLKKGTMYKHKRTDLISKLAPVEFRPSARAPRWELFVNEIMGGDDELVEFLRRAVGYSLTGSTREQCLFFCYGRGSNGKSTFIELIRRLLGDYAQQADFNTFLTRKNEGPRNDLARMRGARFISAVEAHGERGFDETVLKQLTGSDTIVARKLYEEFTEFTPTHKLFLAANHQPMVKEQTEAFWRRIRLIPFTVTFAAEQRDKKLPDRLNKELPGILNWALDGCLTWQEQGLMVPQMVRKATQSYKEEFDVMGEFISQKCAIEKQSWTSSSDMYQAFTEWWTETRGSRSNPLSMVYVTRSLSERQEIRRTKRNGIRGWSGIAIRTEAG